MTKQVGLSDILVVVNRLEDKMDTRLIKLESKVDVLENNQGKAMGALSVLSLASTGLFTWIWSKLTRV